MADPTTTNGADLLEETLNRLSKKPGVKATIAVDRSSGTILKTAGQMSLLHTTRSKERQQAQNQEAAPEDPSAPGAAQQGAAADNTSSSNEMQGAEDLASMVWAFVNTAGGLVDGLDTEDELKLLRVRTKKQELVIVPDAKYLLIVVHETPAA